MPVVRFISKKFESLFVAVFALNLQPKLSKPCRKLKRSLRQNQRKNLLNTSPHPHPKSRKRLTNQDKRWSQQQILIEQALQTGNRVNRRHMTGSQMNDAKIRLAVANCQHSKIAVVSKYNSLGRISQAD